MSRGRMRQYTGDPYWEHETPQEVFVGRVALTYFPKAGKLQVSRLKLDRETGEPRRGWPVITLDAGGLQLEAREILEQFLGK